MLNLAIFSTKKFENYRYEISKIKNQGNTTYIDNLLLKKGERAIDYNKNITRTYYLIEFLYFLKKYKYINNMKYVYLFIRLSIFSLLINAATNVYLDKNLSKYLILNKIEKNNINEFQSFISHKKN